MPRCREAGPRCIGFFLLSSDAAVVASGFEKPGTRPASPHQGSIRASGSRSLLLPAPVDIFTNNFSQGPADARMRLQTALLMLLLFLLPPLSARGQPLSEPDSLAPPPVPDSTARITPPVLPGSVDLFLDTTLVLTRLAREWVDYRSVADLAGEGPGAYLRDPNSAGQYTQITIRGSGWRSVGLSLDGRPLADPASAVFNPISSCPGAD